MLTETRNDSKIRKILFSKNPERDDDVETRKIWGSCVGTTASFALV
jgi:hypothetical protein